MSETRAPGEQGPGPSSPRRPPCCADGLAQSGGQSGLAARDEAARSSPRPGTSSPRPTPRPGPRRPGPPQPRPRLGLPLSSVPPPQPPRRRHTSRAFSWPTSPEAACLARPLSSSPSPFTWLWEAMRCVLVVLFTSSIFILLTWSPSARSALAARSRLPRGRYQAAGPGPPRSAPHWPRRERLSAPLAPGCARRGCRGGSAHPLPAVSRGWLPPRPALPARVGPKGPLSPSEGPSPALNGAFASLTALEWIPFCGAQVRPRCWI